jgi:hypothetical protein
MAVQRKLYVASILGVYLKGRIPNVRHVPIMLDAENIEDAKAEACTAADQFCPKSQFPLRTVVIRPIPAEHYSTLLGVAGPLAGTTWTEEEALMFNCDRIQGVDSQDIVILELDKPAA